VTIENASYRVLFVCMGNICRSPTAEGALRQMLADTAPDLSVFIDSAGTHAYHVGHPPDPRACRAAQRRGIDISSLQARKIDAADYARFDLIIAMDRLNLAAMKEQAEQQFHGRIKLLLEFVPEFEQQDVPDPYYGGASGFEHVLDLVEAANRALIAHIRESIV